MSWKKKQCHYTIKIMRLDPYLTSYFENQLRLNKEIKCQKSRGIYRWILGQVRGKGLKQDTRSEYKKRLTDLSMLKTGGELRAFKNQYIFKSQYIEQFLKSESNSYKLEENIRCPYN